VGRRRADGDDARAEFDADGHVVMWREAAFAEADCELVAVNVLFRGEEREGLTLDLPQPESPNDTIFAM
jgi:hypothetical protein